MARLPNSFDISGTPPQDPGQGQLPPSDANGWPVVIVNSQIKPAQSGGDNGYVEFTLQITEGEHKGATGPYRLNLWNDNPTTVEIAYKQLSALGYVCGVPIIDDTAQLHNRAFRVITALQEEPENAAKGWTRVRGVRSIGGQTPSQIAAGAPPQTQAAAPAAGPPMANATPPVTAPPPAQPSAPPVAPPAAAAPAPPSGGAVPPWER